MTEQRGPDVRTTTPIHFTRLSKQSRDIDEGLASGSQKLTRSPTFTVLSIIVGSAHNLKEIRTKEIQNVTKIFLSSLFKKNKNFLGINKFKLVSKLTKKKIVVLGGISKENIKKLSLLKKSEFAGISYFE